LHTSVHQLAHDPSMQLGAAGPSHELAGHTHLGHQAVIVFFVLSGYFVGGGALRAVRNRKWSTKLYLFQRLTRLWVVLIPALLLGLLMDTAGVRLFSNATPVYASLYSPVSRSVWNVIPFRFAASTFMGNVFFLQGILVPCFGTNGPLWSLSYEFWYYIAGLIAILIFCGRDISLYFLIWMMGALISCLSMGISQPLARRITPWVCALFMAFNLYAVAYPCNLIASDFATGIFFSFVLWLLLHFRQPATDSIYRKASTRLSAMSYTLYTVHYPIILFLSVLLLPKLPGPHSSLQSIGILLAAYVATFSIAYLFYRCFEANTARVRRIFSAHLGIS